MGRRRFLALLAAALGALVLPLPARQRFHRGGPVLSGRPYLVGEAGPEMFITLQSGCVIYPSV